MDITSADHFARLAKFWRDEAAIAEGHGDVATAELFRDGAKNVDRLLKEQRTMADHYGRATK